MKCTLPLLLGALLLSAALPVTSAESEDDKRTDTKADESEAKRAPVKPAEVKNKSKDKEIFIPSEEISEDFAVSFPVDI